MTKIDPRRLQELGFTPYDTAEKLETEDDVLQFMRACAEEAAEDAAFIAHALGTVARSRALMSKVAGESGLSRESLYRALSGKRDLRLSTALKVSSALGLRISFEPKRAAPSQERSAETFTAAMDIEVALSTGRRVRRAKFVRTVGAGDREKVFSLPAGASAKTYAQRIFDQQGTFDVAAAQPSERQVFGISGGTVWEGVWL